MSATDQVVAVGVSRRFGTLLANDGIDLTVGAGEVVGLLGANGAGKSTFMRLLLGLLRPTGGRISLFGTPPSRAARRRVGYVPQGLGLYDDLSVAENLGFVAQAYGLHAQPALDDRLRAEAGTLVRDLPLGLRRRLAFAAALCHDPSLLVLDEPTSGVDPLARSRLWDTIRAGAARGAGVLVSTHYLEEVEHCDRVVVLAAGRVLATDTAAGIVAGRRALQIDAERWDLAYGALDAAGLHPSLAGRSLRVLGPGPAQVDAILQAAGVTARTQEVPASFDEAFVALVTAAGRR